MFKEVQNAYEILIDKSIPNFTRPDTGEFGDNDIVPYIKEEKTFIAGSGTTPLLNDKNIQDTLEDLSFEFDKNIKAGNYDNFFKVEDKTDFEKLIESAKYADPLNNLTEKQIAQKIEIAEKKYNGISNNVMEKAYLWKAEKAEAATIYIFSSIHEASFDKDDIFGDAIDNIIDKVDEVFTEVNAQNSLYDHISNNLDLDKKTYLGQDLKNKPSFQKPLLKPPLKYDLGFDDLSSKGYFKSANDFDLCKGMFIHDSFKPKSEINSQKNIVPRGIDDYIRDKAFAKLKPIRNLENSTIRKVAEEGTIKKFDRKAMLNYKNTHAAEYQKELSLFSDNYLMHVSPSQDELNDLNDESQISTIKRNLFWMEPILSNSSEEKKTSLVVCGSIHNAGKFGLPNLLASEGYTLVPLMKTPPTSKSTLIRDAFIGHGPTFFKSKAQSVEKPSEQNQPGSLKIK
ncbi:MAG: TraB/GumN family protein [Tatlockia sp.]|nr:TraB/GumN family protein [Tatlockia sp.]